LFKLIAVSWLQFLSPLLLAAILSWGLLAGIKYLTTKYQWWGHQSAHHDARQITRLGGIAVWLTFLIVFLGFVDLTPPRLALLVGMTLLFLMGLVDDIYNLSPITKLIWQIGAVAIAVGLGLHIGQVTNPFGGVIVLSPIWDYLLSGFWLLIVVNAVNMLDGLDGLSAGATSIFSIIIFFLSLFVIVNQPTTATMAVILLGTMLGYLWWNWHPAKIFYGDAGSNMVGFIMGALAIVSGGKIATAALVLGFPIMDLLWAAFRRIKQGRSPFAADREHLHHRLLDAGVPHQSAVVIILALVALFGVVSLLSGTWAKLIALFGVALLMIILVRTVFFLQRRKSH
jgi:UDP-GlcNAc:undecaprenyl-phosphate GlcNAc-1-phosphate transferase